MREAVLQADALGLSRKFQAFTLDHVEASFYRSEVVDALRPISANALPHALVFAYQARSRQVHVLEQLVPEIWAIADRSDTVPIDGRPVLSLEGLSRLCRHVIRRYVDRAPTDLDATFNYPDALPGVVRMQLSAEFWVGHPDGVRAENGPAVLGGFLEVCLPVLRGHSTEIRVDMRSALERVEAILSSENSAERRAPLVALYVLWHRMLPKEFHRPEADSVIARFGGDLDTPSAASFAARVILTGDVPWPTEELAAFAAERSQERRGKAEPLPSVFDAALELCLARRLGQEGRTEEGMSALGRAVETVPGDKRLMALEDQVASDEVDRTAELAALDLSSWFHEPSEAQTEDLADAAEVEEPRPEVDPKFKDGSDGGDCKEVTGVPHQDA